MFEKAYQGILFSTETTFLVEKRIRALGNQKGFFSVLELMSILNTLSISKDIQLLSNASFSNVSKSYNSRRVEKVVDYLNIGALSKLILDITLLTSFSGVVNLGSGTPITVASQTRHWIEDLNLDLKITESVGNTASEGFWSDRSLLDSVLSAIEES